MDDNIRKFFNYLQYEKRLSSNTIIAYKIDIAQFQSFMLDHFQESNILSPNHAMIRAWMIHLIEKKEVANTVNRKVSCLKSFYKYMLKNGMIHTNPTSKIIRPKSPKKLPKAIALNKLIDVKDILELEKEESQSFESHRDYTMFLLFYASGIRRSELIDLSWNSVDMSLKQLSIVGKGKKQRFVPLQESMIAHLKEYKAALAHHAILPEDDRVFVLKNGKALYPNLAYRTIKKYLSLVSTSQGIGPHTLRHSFATHLLDEGAELNAIKELMGHSSLAATQVYTHNSIEKLKEIHKFSHPKS